MFDNNFLYNYMFLRSKSKSIISSSKAASLAFQSSAFTTSPVGGFLSANNLFAKEKSDKLKKDALNDKEILEKSIKDLGMDEAAIKSLPDKNLRLYIAKATGFGIDNILTSSERSKVKAVGDIGELSYKDIKEKIIF